MKREQAARFAVIVNISKEEHVMHRTHGVYLIPPRPSGKEYSLCRITPGKDHIDLGDKNRMEIDIDPNDIAEDLCKEINSNAGPNSYLGVFVCDGEIPTEKELKAAHAKLTLFYEGIVASADLNHERGGGLLLDVGDLERRAAKYLGVAEEKPWCHQATSKAKQQDCPACGDKLKIGVAVCKSCGAILDKAKAAQYGLIPKHEKSKPAPAAV
jgi:hypothetical protein